jgi:hypothetical protein
LIYFYFFILLHVLIYYVKNQRVYSTDSVKNKSKNKGYRKSNTAAL